MSSACALACTSLFLDKANGSPVALVAIVHVHCTARTEVESPRKA